MTKIVQTYEDGEWNPQEETSGGGSLPSGAASPSGVVTPSGVDALYLDTTHGSLYIATGATSADWRLVGSTGDNLKDIGIYETSVGAVAVLNKGGLATTVSDIDAFNNTGNGLVWSGADGAQILVAQVGSTGQFMVTLADADGHSVIRPPTADPHIAGAIWNNAGTLAVSAG